MRRCFKGFDPKDHKSKQRINSLYIIVLILKKKKKKKRKKNKANPFQVIGSIWIQLKTHASGVSAFFFNLFFNPTPLALFIRHNSNRPMNSNFIIIFFIVFSFQ